METVTIGNVSTTDTLLASVLPRLFQLNGDIAASSSKEYVLADHDLDMIEDQHTGFTSRELLQQLKQLNIISFSSTTLVSYPSAERPDAAGFSAGESIWNSDDNAPNYSDGAGNWRDAAGTIT